MKVAAGGSLVQRGVGLLSRLRWLAGLLRSKQWFVGLKMIAFCMVCRRELAPSI